MMSRVIHTVSHVYNWYLDVATYTEHKYEAFKAWTLDGQVFYKAVIGGQKHYLIYNYDTFFYVMILAMLKVLSLSHMILMDTPDNIVLHGANSINVYAYYHHGKIHGVLTRGRRHEITTHVHPLLFVMIDNIINVTNELTCFKRYVNAMEITAKELMECLWVFKHRRESFARYPPIMTTLSILYDRTYQEQEIAADDIVVLSHS